VYFAFRLHPLCFRSPTATKTTCYQTSQSITPANPLSLGDNINLPSTQLDRFREARPGVFSKKLSKKKERFYLSIHPQILTMIRSFQYPFWISLHWIFVVWILGLMPTINAFVLSTMKSSSTAIGTLAARRPGNRLPPLVLPFPTTAASYTNNSGHPRADTSLKVMLDVPPHFFATSFVMMGLVLDVSKSFGRLRMEERAWEQRLEEAREKRLQEDPTLTELELRRKEAALEWSAYGKPRQEELERERQMREEEERQQFGGGRRRKGVRVMECDLDDDDDDEEETSFRAHRMTDDDINAFELEYGVEYDPYYDDPYSEDELPDDMSYKIDKRYGDRIYSNGEIFYKDKESGLFYRQGAKPRSLSFW
jgi:hypothetical protein